MSNVFKMPPRPGTVQINAEDAEADEKIASAAETAANELLKQLIEDEAAEKQPKSIEIDMIGLGTAPTQAHPVTIPPPVAPAPAPDPDPELIVENVPDSEPPPAPKVPTYRHVEIRLKPDTIVQGEETKVIVLGYLGDNVIEPITDFVCVCEPANAGTFEKKGADLYFTAKKAGSTKIVIAILDPTSGSFNETASLKVYPAAPQIEEASVVVSPSLIDLTTQATVEHEAKKQREQMPAMNGPVGRPPLPAARKKKEPVVEMKAVTEGQLRFRAIMKKVAMGVVAIAALGLGTVGAFYLTPHVVNSFIALAPTVAPAATPTEPDAAVVEAPTPSEPESLPAPTPVPAPVVVAPAPTSSHEPGLIGAHGARVTTLARRAFPTSCRTGWTTRRTDGVFFNCGPGELHGANVCACDATGVIP
ncbi:MAG: hypothetical protein WCK01_00210 [Candidatus Uhrbacteria bacterium]